MWLHSMAYNYDSVPDGLKQLPQWVVWKKETDEKGKVKKVPRNPITGYGASSTDPETWNTFITARDIYEETKGYDGIGFVFNNSGIVGVDLDHCIDETGQMTETAQEIIQVLDSYTEYSPSGTGVHIYAYGTLPVDGKKKEPYEMYQNKRYFTVTGQSFHNPPKQIQYKGPEILKIYERLFPQVEAPAQQPISGFSVLNADEVVNRIRASRQGQTFEALYQGDISAYPSQSEADMALCNMLAFWCAKDAQMMDTIFRQSGLYRPKWDVKHGPETYGNITIQKAIAGTTEVYTPKKEMYGHEIVTVEGGQNSPGVPVVMPAFTDSSDYNNMEFLEPEWMIKDIIPDKGLAGIYAKPKVGKTWMTYGIAYAVVTGGEYMGSKMKKGGVIYFDIETPARVRKQRLMKMTGGAPIPPGIKFIDSARTINHGFQDDLELMLKEWPDTKLVIIDTIKKIRNPKPSNLDQNLHDDIEIGALAKFTNDHDILILCNNHNVKMNNEDPFDNALGSISVQGSLDSILVITQEKDDNGRTTSTTLHVKGREIEEEHFAVKFEDCNWSMIGKADDFNIMQRRDDFLNNPITKTITALLTKENGYSWKGKAKDLMTEGARIVKKELAPTSQALTKAIRNMETDLIMYCGIEHQEIDQGKTHSAIHRFYMPIIEDGQFTEITDSS